MQSLAVYLLLLALSVHAAVPAKRSRSRGLSRHRKPAASPARPEAIKQVQSLLAAPPQPVENAAALVPFFERLAAVQAGSPEPTRILQWGDSHTAADEWTGTLRELFQGRFGNAGAGFSHAGRPWPSYRRTDVRSRASRNWRTDGLRANSDGRNGMAGVSISATRAGEWITLEADCRKAELWYSRQPGGGRLTVSAGSGSLSVETDGRDEPGFLEQECGDGSSLLRMETSEKAPVRLFGWVTERGPGVTYETLGINGAQATVLLGWDADFLRAHIERRRPALLVLAYGTNEAGQKDWNYDSYREAFASVLGRLREFAPSASILIIGPPDREQRRRLRWEPVEKLDAIIAAQRDAAYAAGCAFWDQRAKMGGKGSVRTWVAAGLAQRDHVHLSGPGYRALGRRAFDDLMESYAGFRGEASEAGNHQTNGQAKQNH